MGLAVLIVTVIVLAGLDGWTVQRRRAGDRVGITARRPMPPLPSTPGDLERVLTRRLMAGQLDPDRYRDCLAAVAATVDRASLVDETRGVTDLGDESYLLACRLAEALPHVPEATLGAAVNLTRFGAGVDDLTRLLGLSGPDAMRIVTRTSGGYDNDDEVVDDLTGLMDAFQADPADAAEQRLEIPMDDEPDR